MGDDEITAILKCIPYAAPVPSIDDAYKAGMDCAKNGANEQNCHFSIFRTREHTKAWERGKREGAA